MFLSIDVGNTQTAIGLFDSEGTMVRGWRMPTDQSDTSDILHGRLFTFFQKDGLSLDDVEAGGLSCVVPVITRAWQRCFELLLNKPLTRINALSTDKIRFNIPHPELVGADRVANSVAATERYGYPVIVVDFGTATNLDVVDKDGVFRGGAISPGIMISANALFVRAASSPAFLLRHPRPSWATPPKALFRQVLWLVLQLRLKVWLPGLLKSLVLKVQPLLQQVAWQTLSAKQQMSLMLLTRSLLCVAFI